MDTKFVMMTYAEWIEKYKPVLDEFGEPRYFETYGVDVNFVKEQNPLTIWTDEDIEGEAVIFSGWHYVNRLGYYLTAVPFEEGTQVTVTKPQEEEDLDEISVDSPEWTCHYCTETNVCEPPMADNMRVECENCGEKFILRIGRKNETQ